MFLRSFSVVIGATIAWLCEPAFLNAADSFAVAPAQVALHGNFAQVQILVATPTDFQGPVSADDLTRQATYQSSNEQIAVATSTGQVIPRGDGTAEITVRVGESSKSIPVTVTGFTAEPAIDYLEQVRPVLYKAGCNMGACHAAQHGQGGFKLSVFGFDPQADRTAMVRENFGRRINQVDPAASLLLRKATMQIPHGGGRRLQLASRDYELLTRWIHGGAPGPASEKAMSKLVVTPAQRTGEPGLKQQLRVEAVYADGTSRDVTAWAKFDSMDEGLVSVTRDGLCTVAGRGQAPVMVRFEGQADIAMFVIPYGPPPSLEVWSNQNFVDELAASKFRELGIEPSPLCDDSTFLRRIFLMQQEHCRIVKRSTNF